MSESRKSGFWPEGKPPAPTDPEALSRLERRLEERVVVVVKRPQQSGNLGRLARFMHNMGVSQLRLVDPFCKDRDEAIKTAVHARGIVEAAWDHPFATIADAVADRELVLGTYHPLGRQGRAVRAEVVTARVAGEHVASLLATEEPPTIAVLLGSEKWGLNNEDLARCHALISIPARAENSSLNLANAGLVILYELYQACYRQDPSPRTAFTWAGFARAKQSDVDLAAQKLALAAKAARFGRPDVEEIARSMLLGRAADREQVAILAAIFARFARGLERTQRGEGGEKPESEGSSE